jgi:RNA polymerase sigma-70 factor (ECF subfamily)
MSSAPVAIPIPSSEVELIERHRLGDPAAFEEIYRQHEKMVFNLALRMTSSREDAAELVQEVFLRVYRSLERFRGGSTLKTWVFRIALNCCRSRYRRRRLVMWQPRQDDEEFLERIVDPKSDPEADALNSDLGERLTAALGEVPFAFREAVILRDIHGFSYEEISHILRIRVGTVRSRIARGRERLRRLLESEA